MSVDVDSEYTAEVSKILYQQALNKKFTDFEIRVGNKRVACHRAVVSAKSEYFDSVCSSGLTEAVLDHASDEHGHFLEAIVKFMYLGKTDLTVDNAEPMLLAADFIKHADLKRYCEEFMSTNLTVTNFIPYQKCAAKLHLTKLSDECVRLRTEHFTSIVETDWFRSLSIDEVCEYLQDEELVADSEDDVMKAIHIWLQSTKASASVKEDYVERLFPCARIRFCSESTLKSMSTDKEVMSSMRLKILEYLQHGLHGDGSARKSLSRKAARTTEEQVLLVGGRLMGQKGIHTNMVLLDQDPESSILDKPPLCEHSTTFAACYGQGLIMSGGFNTATQSTMKTVQLFNLSDRSWWDLPDLTQPLFNHGSACVNSAYYTIGGMSISADRKEHVHSSVMKLDLITMSWSACQSLPLAVFGAGVAVVESDIFVVSGHTGKEVTPLVSKYNTETGRRTACAEIPETFGLYKSTVAFNRVLFALSKCRFMQYDTATDQWTKLPSPLEPSKGCAMVHHQGRLLVLGGFKDTVDHPNDQVQAYDLTEKKWMVENRAMPLPVSDAWAFVMKIPK